MAKIRDEETIVRPPLPPEEEPTFEPRPFQPPSDLDRAPDFRYREFPHFLPPGVTPFEAPTPEDFRRFIPPPTKEEEQPPFRGQFPGRGGAFPSEFQAKIPSLPPAPSLFPPVFGKRAQVAPVEKARPTSLQELLEREDTSVEDLHKHSRRLGELVEAVISAPEPTLVENILNLLAAEKKPLPGPLRVLSDILESPALLGVSALGGPLKPKQVRNIKNFLQDQLDRGIPEHLANQNAANKFGTKMMQRYFESGGKLDIISGKAVEPVAGAEIPGLYGARKAAERFAGLEPELPSAFKEVDPREMFDTLKNLGIVGPNAAFRNLQEIGAAVARQDLDKALMVDRTIGPEEYKAISGNFKQADPMRITGPQLEALEDVPQNIKEFLRRGNAEKRGVIFPEFRLEDVPTITAEGVEIPTARLIDEARASLGKPDASTVLERKQALLEKIAAKKEEVLIRKQEAIETAVIEKATAKAERNILKFKGSVSAKTAIEEDTLSPVRFGARRIVTPDGSITGIVPDHVLVISAEGVDIDHFARLITTKEDFFVSFESKFITPPMARTIKELASRANRERLTVFWDDITLNKRGNYNDLAAGLDQAEAIQKSQQLERAAQEATTAISKKAEDVRAEAQIAGERLGQELKERGLLAPAGGAGGKKPPSTRKFLGGGEPPGPGEPLKGEPSDLQTSWFDPVVDNPGSVSEVYSDARSLMPHKNIGTFLWAIPKEAANFPRALMASTDLSGSLLQGSISVFAHNPEWRLAFRDQIKAFSTVQGTKEVAAFVKTLPTYRFFNRLGLVDHLSGPESVEFFQSALAAEFGRKLTHPIAASRRIVNNYLRDQNLPQIFAIEGGPVAASNRAYEGLLTSLRYRIADNIARSWGLPELELANPKMAEELGSDLASFINHITGRGDYILPIPVEPARYLGKGKFAGLGEPAKTVIERKGAQALSWAFFAPRFLMSRFQAMTDPFLFLGKTVSGRYGPPFKKSLQPFNVKSWRLAYLAFKDMFIYWMTQFAIGYLIRASGVGEFFDDPTQTQFGQSRIGNHFIDVSGGLPRTFAWFWQLKEGKKTNLRGKVFDLDDPENFTDPTKGNVFLGFLAGKLGVPPEMIATAWLNQNKNLITGEDKGVTGHIPTPLGIRSLIEAFEDDIKNNPFSAKLLASEIGLGLFATAGGRVQTYEPERRRPRFSENIIDVKLRELFGRPRGKKFFR